MNVHEPTEAEQGTGADRPMLQPMLEPLLQVVRGNPTPEELAALVVVVATRARPQRVAPSAASGWGAYWRGLQTAPAPGPGAWRAAGRSW